MPSAMMITTLALQLLAADPSPPRYAMTTDVTATLTTTTTPFFYDTLGAGSAVVMAFHLRPVLDDGAPRSQQVWLQRAPTVTVRAGGGVRLFDVPGVDASERDFGLGAALRYDTRGPAYLRASLSLTAVFGSATRSGDSGWAVAPDASISWEGWGVLAAAAGGVRFDRFEVELGALLARYTAEGEGTEVLARPSGFGGYASARAMIGRYVSLEGGARYLPDAVTLWIEPGLLIGRDLSVKAAVAHSFLDDAGYSFRESGSTQAGLGVGYWLGAVQLNARYDAQVTEVATSHGATLGVAWRSR